MLQNGRSNAKMMDMGDEAEILAHVGAGRNWRGIQYVKRGQADQKKSAKSNKEVQLTHKKIPPQKTKTASDLTHRLPITDSRVQVQTGRQPSNSLKPAVRLRPHRCPYSP